MVCKRRKAFIGTAISLGASIVGGIVGGKYVLSGGEDKGL